MRIEISTFVGSDKKIKQLNTIGQSEFFLKTDNGKVKKSYRLSVDLEGDLRLTLING